jgi:hypothetical protein
MKQQSEHTSKENTDAHRRQVVFHSASGQTETLSDSSISFHGDLLP